MNQYCVFLTYRTYFPLCRVTYWHLAATYRSARE